ncbi:hypothetical protein C3495_05205 [Clostridiaceae bacterium 14S0207]|nr:hypothetical protein C3495_05205 [Clostridiaceae bacterium 14S0207]
MKEKQKGFTLIELLVVISIISVFGSIFFMAYKRVEYNKTQKELNFYANCSLDFINNAIEICRSQNKKGRIIYNFNKNVLELYMNEGKYKDSLRFPKNIKLICGFPTRERININNLGLITEGGTITFKNHNGEKGEVVISVYTNKRKIKK